MPGSARGEQSESQVEHDRDCDERRSGPGPPDFEKRPRRRANHVWPRKRMLIRPAVGNDRIVEAVVDRTFGDETTSPIIRLRFRINPKVSPDPEFGLCKGPCLPCEDTFLDAKNEDHRPAAEALRQRELWGMVCLRQGPVRITRETQRRKEISHKIKRGRIWQLEGGRGRWIRRSRHIEADLGSRRGRPRHTRRKIKRDKVCRHKNERRVPQRPVSQSNWGRSERHDSTDHRHRHHKQGEQDAYSQRC